MIAFLLLLPTALLAPKAKVGFITSTDIYHLTSDRNLRVSSTPLSFAWRNPVIEAVSLHDYKKKTSYTFSYPYWHDQLLNYSVTADVICIRHPDINIVARHFVYYPLQHVSLLQPSGRFRAASFARQFDESMPANSNPDIESFFLVEARAYSYKEDETVKFRPLSSREKEHRTTSQPLIGHYCDYVTLSNTSAACLIFHKNTLHLAIHQQLPFLNMKSKLNSEWGAMKVIHLNETINSRFQGFYLSDNCYFILLSTGESKILRIDKNIGKFTDELPLAERIVALLSNSDSSKLYVFTSAREDPFCKLKGFLRIADKMGLSNIQFEFDWDDFFKARSGNDMLNLYDLLKSKNLIPRM